jgi:hypothetical protein
MRLAVKIVNGKKVHGVDSTRWNRFSLQVDGAEVLVTIYQCYCLKSFRTWTLPILCYEDNPCRCWFWFIKFQYSYPKPPMKSTKIFLPLEKQDWTPNLWNK